MYNFQNINLHFGDFHVFENISFVITKGEKIALLGKNGAGKTTLFKVMTDELKPDTGSKSLPAGTRIGYLSQHLEIDESITIMDTCLACFQDLIDAQKRIDDINLQLQDNPEGELLERLLEEQNQLLTKIQSSDSSNPEAQAGKVLKGFGFKHEQFDNPVSTLSGGWQMRVQMAKLLLTQPDLLLLDEPDNHLDIEALIWFEKYLQNYPGAVLFISHDTDFISNLANRILELSNRSLDDYKLPYKKYLDAKALRQEKELQAFKNQQKVIKDKERTIKRFMAKATKTKMAQSMKKQLDKIERVELSSVDITVMNIRFPLTVQPGKVVATVKDCDKSYGDNHVLDKVDLLVERGQKIAFVGQNGQGKSTLVKIIADSIPYNSGTVDLGHNVILTYFAQDEAEKLDTKITVLETLEKEADPELHSKCRNILGSFAFSGEDVEKKVSVLSGGEKSRLAMACLVSKKSNFLILDEPTNHLDIHAKAILKQALIDYPGTLIIVSHDREILRGTVDITYEFRNRKLIQHLGDLDYVLQKREMSDVRDLATSSDNSKAKKKQNKSTDLSYEERKKINRNISRIEKKIAEAEKNIKELQNKLMDPDFYNSAEGPKAIKELNLSEEAVEKLNGEWDEWVTKLPD